MPRLVAPERMRILIHVSVKVAVAGASGYAGGEMLRLLLGHPEVEIGALTASTSAGSEVGQHHPHLRPLARRVLEPTTVDVLADADVVVLALPHGTSAAVAEQLPGKLVIDCGADFRLQSATDWESFYHSSHAGTWPYGLAELMHAGETQPRAQRDILRAASHIAVNGCNAGAVTLALQPGLALIDTSAIVATLAVGYSGAGKAAKPHLMAAQALGNMAPYAAGGTHRHIPEIEQNFRIAGATQPRVSFQPILVPTSRGILASVTAPLVGDPDEVRTAWEAAYAGEPFVELLPPDQWPTTAMVTGANSALIQVAVDHHAGRVQAVCAIDNLVKGTAGSAIQAMNLALGLPETTGLTSIGVAP